MTMALDHNGAPNHPIRDRNGNVIQTSANLAGIRRYVSRHLVKTLAVDAIGAGPVKDGKLTILFDDGSSYETSFACFSILCRFVRHWHNTYGAPLLVNGHECGTVSHNNAALLTGEKN